MKPTPKIKNIKRLQLNAIVNVNAVVCYFIKNLFMNDLINQLIRRFGDQYFSIYYSIISLKF